MQLPRRASAWKVFVAVALALVPLLLAVTEGASPNRVRAYVVASLCILIGVSNLLEGTRPLSLRVIGGSVFALATVGLVLMHIAVPFWGISIVAAFLSSLPLMRGIPRRPVWSDELYHSSDIVDSYEQARLDPDHWLPTPRNSADKDRKT
jgi:hypothetical protein